MKISQKSLRIFSSQTTRDSKSSTRFSVDSEIHSMTVQSKTQSVQRNPKQREAEVAVVEVSVVAEAAGQETKIQTERFLTCLHQTLRQVREAVAEVVDVEEVEAKLLASSTQLTKGLHLLPRRESSMKAKNKKFH